MCFMKNVSSLLGNNKPCSVWGKVIVFFCCFVFLFHICLFPPHRDSDQSLITEDGLQTWFNDFKQTLQLSINAVRTVWEVCDLCLTNPGLNLPAGVWTLLFFCIRTTPQFHEPQATLRCSCSISNGPLWGNENQSPQETPISFNWACFNLFSSQTLDVWHSCNCWRRCLWFTVIHQILMWFIWLPEVRQIPHFYLFFIVRTCTKGWTWFLLFRYECLHST